MGVLENQRRKINNKTIIKMVLIIINMPIIWIIILIKISNNKINLINKIIINNIIKTHNNFKFYNKISIGV